jgi:carbamoyl-phosphate synthase large subunit
MRVLVTGVGGPAGVCLVKALREQHSLVPVDSDPMAAGLYLSESKHHIVPKAGDRKFIQTILELARKEMCNMVIPSVQEELVKFSRNLNRFDEIGVKVVVSNTQSLLRSNDKSKTYSFFKGESYCPKVYDNWILVDFPVAVKPKNSRGSRGFYKCSNEREIKVAIEQNSRLFDGSIIMEYIPGTEYSTYGLSDLSGKPIVAVPLRRILAVSESKRAETVHEPEVSEIASDIAKKLGLVGPWNVQLKRAENGSLKLIEVNPRFAGSLSLVIASGVDLPNLAIKLFTGQKINEGELKYQSNLFMVRYNEEVFISKEILERATK